MNHACLRKSVLAAMLSALALLVPGGAHADGEWPQFRGPSMNPVIEGNPNLPQRFVKHKFVKVVSFAI